MDDAYILSPINIPNRPSPNYTSPKKTIKNKTTSSSSSSSILPNHHMNKFNKSHTTQVLLNSYKSSDSKLNTVISESNVNR